MAKKKQAAVSHNYDQYPKKFMDDLVKELDPDLREFYLSRQEMRKKGFEEPFEDLAIRIWDMNVNGKMREEELRAIWRSNRKKITRTKRSWYTSLMTNLEQCRPGEGHYPFNDVYRMTTDLSPDQWMLVYGTASFESVIRQRTKMASDWAESETSKLTEFPAVRAMTDKKMITALQHDLLNNEFQIVHDKFKMNLEDIFISYTDGLVDGGYFSNESKKYPVPKSETDVVDLIPLASDGTRKMALTIGQKAFGDKNFCLALDMKDRNILFYIIRSAVSGSFDNSVISIELGELAQHMMDGTRPGKRQYDDAENRCYKLTEFTYRRIDESGKQTKAINYLGSAVRREASGKVYMDVTLGPLLAQEVMNNKVRRIATEEYNKLQLKTSKVIVLAMQRERIRAFYRMKQDPTQECATTFNYNNFLAMVNFKTANKKKNMAAIKEAMQEFKELNLMIEAFSVDNVSNTIRVWFYPLTETEQHDLVWTGYDAIADESAAV